MPRFAKELLKVENVVTAVEGCTKSAHFLMSSEGNDLRPLLTERSSNLTVVTHYFVRRYPT